MTVYCDEEMNKNAAKWVRENAFTKGKTNMTAPSFCQWVNEDLLPSSQLPPHFNGGYRCALHFAGCIISGSSQSAIVKVPTSMGMRETTWSNTVKNISAPWLPSEGPTNLLQTAVTSPLESEMNATKGRSLW